MNYQRILLSTGAKVGALAPLPAELVGLNDEHLADLPAALEPCPDAWADTAFLPVSPAPAEPVLRFVVDVPSFFMRFTAPERIAIRESHDPVVADFLALINDPRTAKVNLALPTVQQGVAYLAGQLPGVGGAPLDPAILAAERVAQILAGESA